MKRAISLAAVFALFPSLAQAQAFPTLTQAQVQARSWAATGAIGSPAYRIISTETDSRGTSLKSSVHKGRDYVTIYKNGDAITANGSYNGQAWKQDENGVVFLSTNFRSARTFEFDDMRPDDSLTNAAAIVTVHDRPEYEVDRIASGKLTQYFYDAKTFYLDRIDYHASARRTWTTILSDYRPVGKGFRSFHQETTDEKPDDAITTKIIRYEPLTADAAQVGVPESKELFAPDSDTAPVPVDAIFTPIGVIISTKINGTGMDFILDSGAVGMAIDIGAAHRAHLTIDEKRHHAIADTMDVSGLKAQDVNFDMVSYSEDYGHHHIVGLIGSDFLASNPTTVDFPKALVTVYPGTTFDPKLTGVKATPVELDDWGWARTAIWIDGHRGNFVLDTGAFGTLIDPSIASQVTSGPPNGDEILIEGIGREARARPHDVHNIIFGGVEYKNANLYFPVDPAFSFNGYDGLIGRELLANYAITFDYANSQIYLAPGAP